MPIILIVEKQGSIKELTVKNWNEGELYKKAGFKNKDDFKYYTNWNLTLNNITYDIHLYGKTNGKANQENKYEFPPPVDNTLFFGKCVLVNKSEDSIEDLTSKEWNSIYENLYGGFEDIDQSDDDFEDDDDLEGLKLTKDGYVKDDFIVDESEDDYEDEDSDNYEDEDDDVAIKKTKKIKKVSSKNKFLTATKKILLEEPVEPNFLDCTDELQEEDFL